MPTTRPSGIVVPDTTDAPTIPAHLTNMVESIEDLMRAGTFKVYLGANFAVATGGGGSVILFDSEVFDYSSASNPANGRFTAPIAGVYQFGYLLAPIAESGDTQMDHRIVKNGVTATPEAIKSETVPITGQYRLSLETLVVMAAGDYVDVRVSHNDSDTVDLVGAAGDPSNSQFWGHLVAPAD